MVTRKNYGRLFNLLNTFNQFSSAFNKPSRSEADKSDQNIRPSRSKNHLDMPGKRLTMVYARPDMETPQTKERESRGKYLKQYFKYFKRDQDQDEDGQQEPDQGVDEDRDQGIDEDPHKKLWWKEMLRRTG